MNAVTRYEIDAECSVPDGDSTIVEYATPTGPWCKWTDVAARLEAAERLAEALRRVIGINPPYTSGSLGAPNSLARAIQAEQIAADSAARKLLGEWEATTAPTGTPCSPPQPPQPGEAGAAPEPA